MFIFLIVLTYLAVTSAIAYRAFARDKQFAIDKVYRTPEAKLLFYAIIGGWPGAKYAQQKLRHKSYKEPFRTQLNDIGKLQGAVLGTFAIIGTVLLLGAPDPSLRVAAVADAPAQQPVPAPPHVSLRPPAARPATL